MTASNRHFGTGWISGTASVSLAVIGLLAVFCFHFPSYLTMPQVREYYPVPFIRGALHLVLVAAFLLGLASVMLRHNKILGMTGMAIVAFTALLGGSRVELDSQLKDDFYLGLDYALLILIVYSLIFIPIEKLFGRLHQSVFRYGWQIDATYFFISTMLVQLTTYMGSVPSNSRVRFESAVPSPISRHHVSCRRRSVLGPSYVSPDTLALEVSRSASLSGGNGLDGWQSPSSRRLGRHSQPDLYPVVRVGIFGFADVCLHNLRIVAQRLYPFQCWVSIWLVAVYFCYAAVPPLASWR
jgi:hypothetical protein